MYVVVSDICIEEPCKIIESIRICNGSQELKQYQDYIDFVNSGRNYQHDVYIEEIRQTSNPQYLAIALNKCSNLDKGSPDLETARLFEDIESAKTYVSSFPSNDYKYGAIIRMKDLVWEYSRDVNRFPRVLNKDSIVFVPMSTKKSKKNSKK